MVEVVLHLVVLRQTQQVAMLHVHQIVRLHFNYLTNRSRIRTLTDCSIPDVHLASRFILIDDHRYLGAWLLRNNLRCTATAKMKRVSIIVGDSEKGPSDIPITASQRGAVIASREKLSTVFFVHYIAHSATHTRNAMGKYTGEAPLTVLGNCTHTHALVLVSNKYRRATFSQWI